MTALDDLVRLARAPDAAANQAAGDAYVAWARQFILFHGKRHPAEMGEREVAAFLSHLASARDVSASTQNQALGALLFLSRLVLRRELGRLGGIVRARVPNRLPVVMTRDEVRAVLAKLAGGQREHRQDRASSRP